MYRGKPFAHAWRLAIRGTRRHVRDLSAVPARPQIRNDHTCLPAPHAPPPSTARPTAAPIPFRVASTTRAGSCNPSDDALDCRLPTGRVLRPVQGRSGVGGEGEEEGVRAIRRLDATLAHFVLRLNLHLARGGNLVANVHEFRAEERVVAEIDVAVLEPLPGREGEFRPQVPVLVTQRGRLGDVDAAAGKAEFHQAVSHAGSEPYRINGDLIRLGQRRRGLVGQQDAPDELHRIEPLPLLHGFHEDVSLSLTERRLVGTLSSAVEPPDWFDK